MEKVEYRNTSGTVTGSDDYTYDDQLRRSGSTSADGIVRALTYNDNQQLKTDTLSYGGQDYMVTYPSGQVVDYTFTNRQQLDTISWAGTQIEDRAYDAGGRLTNVDRAFTDEVRTCLLYTSPSPRD